MNLPRLTLRVLALIAIAVLFDPAVSVTQGTDVTFFVAGKVARFQQDQDGALAVINYMYFAEVFLTGSGRASHARLTFPGPTGGSKALEYRHSDSPLINDVMYLNGATDSKDELDLIFPDGEYEFNFQTPSGDVANEIVSFEGAAFPRQPVITFLQNGHTVPIDAIDAGRDVIVTWSPFAQGRADPNGILDDLIFVAFDSCTTEDMVHSGRPFEGTDYLTFADTEFRVEAGTFEPGQTYNMYVEHAVLANTRMVSGVPAFATFASSTYMDVGTAGRASADACPPDR